MRYEWETAKSIQIWEDKVRIVTWDNSLSIASSATVSSHWESVKRRAVLEWMNSLIKSCALSKHRNQIVKLFSGPLQR